MNWKNRYRETLALSDKLDHHINWKAHPKKTVERHIRESVDKFINEINPISNMMLTSLEMLQLIKYKAQKIFGERLI